MNSTVDTPTRAAWTLVAEREIRVRARSVTFWVSSAIMVVLIVGGVVTAHLLSGGTTTYHVAVTPGAGAQIVAAADAAGSGAAFESQPVSDAAAAEAAVRAGTVDAALVPADGGGWSLESPGAVDSALGGPIGQAVQAETIATNAQRLGVDPAAVVAGATVQVVSLGTSDDQNVQWAVTFVFGVLFFLSCQLFGATIANGVAEEKESRVVEVLISAIPPRSLLVGKIVGNALVGIAQMALFAAAGLVTASIVGDVPHLAEIVRSSGWFLAFYVIGFGTVCCLFAGLGSLASRTQDLQAATAPVQLIITATYMLSIIGKGTVLTVASFVPVASTVTMPARIFAGAVPWWQVAVSLLLAIGFAVLSVVVAGRLYRVSALRTGGRLGLLAALRPTPSARRHPGSPPSRRPDGAAAEIADRPVSDSVRPEVRV